MQFKQKIVLIIIGILSAGLIGETILRFLDYSYSIYTLDPKTGLSILKPNSTFYWTKSCFKNKVQTNSFGFHSKNYQVFKPANVFRVIIVGDSYIEALQIPLEKSFPYLLEEKLNKLANKKYRYEVIPLGHSGNGTFLNYLYLKKYGSKFKPDLIINAFLVGNDFRDDSQELTQKYQSQTGDLVASFKPFPVFNEKGEIIFNPGKRNQEFSKVNSLKRFFKKSTLLVFLWNKYVETRSNILGRKFLSKNSIKNIIDEIPIDNQVYLKNYPDDVWQETWQVQEKLLSQFNKTANQNNSNFLLVSLTEGFRVHPEMALTGVYKDKNLFDLDKPERLLQEIAEKNNFPYLALVPVFQELAKKEKELTVFSCDGHWNEIGHQWAAEAIFNYLIQNPDLIGIENSFIIQK